MLPDPANPAIFQRENRACCDNDNANGCVGEKPLLIFYITLDTLSFTGNDFQRSVFIIVRTE